MARRVMNKSDGLIPESFYTNNIHILGVGAGGSRVCMELVRLGKTDGKLHIYDMDVVEDVNLENQAYLKKHVGMKKVVAMKELSDEIFGYDSQIVIHQGRLKGDEKLDGIVFMCLDNAETRAKLYKSNQFNANVVVIVDPRLDPSQGEIYTTNCMNVDHMDIQEKSCENIMEEHIHACGTRKDLAHLHCLFAGLDIQKVLVALQNVNYNTHTQMYAGQDDVVLFNN